MRIKSIKQIKNLKGRRVLVRCDFDVPIKQTVPLRKISRKKTRLPLEGQATKTKILDDTRLKACLPTIEYLLKKNVKQIILIGHLGRPDGIDEKYSLKPVRQRLEKVLKKKISIGFITIGRYINQKVMVAIQDAPERAVMLENLRFFDRETANCKRFAKNLAKLADVYVNEAFAVSHRRAASIDAIQDYLPSYAGLHLEQEIKNLSEVINQPRHPLALIIGGAKIETKLPVIKNFLDRADYVLVGGAVANNFLQAVGHEVGRSLVDKEYLDDAVKLLKIQNTKHKTQILNSKLILPIDVVVQNKKVKAVNEIKKTDRILDIGPQTNSSFSDIIRLSKTIVWNGPMGKFEDKKFSWGTLRMAKDILGNKKAKVVIGGGETIEAIGGVASRNIFISTGGGAMLEFLAGKKLPGLRKITSGK